MLAAVFLIVAAVFFIKDPVLASFDTVPAFVTPILVLSATVLVPEAAAVSPLATANCFSLSVSALLAAVCAADAENSFLFSDEVLVILFFKKFNKPFKHIVE